jgi:L-2-hydroxyglutarate oxidase LhgO
MWPSTCACRKPEHVEEVDAVVIGAGVVGLAVARALAMAGREVVILEAESAFGTATSARNSEVLHAGLYYAPGSLKAQWCVRGRALLLDYCAQRGVAFKLCGKLIVATQAEQVASLEALVVRAAACGVDGLVPLTSAQAQAVEPALQCVAAVHSPGTGIVDSHGLMLALLGEAQDHGAVLALCSPVERLVSSPQGVEVRIGGVEPLRVRARTVVNAAGLHAPAVAARTEGLAPAHVPVHSHWARGHYFTCTGAPAFRRLIYPVPEKDGLGIHVTLDLAGQMRFGPDVQWLAAVPRGQEDYSVPPERAAAFAASIRRYWPGLPQGSLQPAYAGLRPKLHAPDEPACDFLLSGPAHHGVPGLVNLMGIESPGLTSCLALAEAVVQQLVE